MTGKACPRMWVSSSGVCGGGELAFQAGSGVLGGDTTRRRPAAWGEGDLATHLGVRFHPITPDSHKTLLSDAETTAPFEEAEPKAPGFFPRPKQVHGEAGMKSKQVQSSLLCSPHSPTRPSTQNPPPQEQGRVTMTSGASSSGGKLTFSISVGQSVHQLCRQVCSIRDLTVGLRRGRRWLEETPRRFWTHLHSHSPRNERPG